MEFKKDVCPVCLASMHGRVGAYCSKKCKSRGKNQRYKKNRLLRGLPGNIHRHINRFMVRTAGDNWLEVTEETFRYMAQMCGIKLGDKVRHWTGSLDGVVYHGKVKWGVPKEPKENKS